VVDVSSISTGKDRSGLTEASSPKGRDHESQDRAKEDRSLPFCAQKPLKPHRTAVFGNAGSATLDVADIGPFCALGSSEAPEASLKPALGY
jgi:hypothetical protein